ncbi:HD domain-containing phosphohydrolase [Pyruvatibacter sp.]|uniref:HD-GYP domain-containing protein n=1 Tax=Pyruvatibacter sp. TaxID=1981328 RepID=UPI0032EED86A
MAVTGIMNAIELDAVDCVHSAQDASDRHTADHELAVGELSSHLGLVLGLPKDDALALGYAARLHDIGKLAVPSSILHKSAPLTVAEQRIMHVHSQAGAQILQATQNLLMRLAAPIALEHHEYINGSGYPHGLSGYEISLAARIVTVCDVYDALRDTRSYKKGMSHKIACHLLEEGDSRISPCMFDDKVLRAFLEHAEELESIYAAGQARKVARNTSQAFL